MKSILTLFLLFCLLPAANGQGKKQPPMPDISEIPKNQSITIDFERFDKKEGVVWLRLTNRTAWAIRIPVELSHYNSDKIALEIIKTAKNHKDGIEAPVRYYLDEYDPTPVMQMTTASGHKEPPDEPEHPPVPKIHRMDFLTEWWINREGSVIFQVPKEHLARNIRLSVNLRYEWENLGVEVLTGPVHYVYFWGINLPKNVQSNIK